MTQLTHLQQVILYTESATDLDIEAPELKGDLSRLLQRVAQRAFEYGQLREIEPKYILTNLDCARAHVGNALAYAEGGNMNTVIANLKLIDKWLQKPDEENTEHDWDDFK